MFGYHFNLNYHFQVFQKGELLVGAGLSLLNRNSEYVRTESILNEEGEIVGSNSSLENYNFSANKIFVGYGKDRSKIMLGIYISRNTKYFDEKTTFILPFISYSFNLLKLWMRNQSNFSVSFSKIFFGRSKCSWDFRNNSKRFKNSRKSSLFWLKFYKFKYHDWTWSKYWRCFDTSFVKTVRIRKSIQYID